MHKFPFDRHHLTIRISTVWLTKDVIFKPYEGKANTMETNFLAAWRIPQEKPLEIEFVPVPTEPGFHFARCFIKCKVTSSFRFGLA